MLYEVFLFPGDFQAQIRHFWQPLNGGEDVHLGKLFENALGVEFFQHFINLEVLFQDGQVALHCIDLKAVPCLVRLFVVLFLSLAMPLLFLLPSLPPLLPIVLP